MVMLIATTWFHVDCYNILTIGIGIIAFHVNIISELVFYHSTHFSTLYYFERLFHMWFSYLWFFS